MTRKLNIRQANNIVTKQYSPIKLYLQGFRNYLIKQALESILRKDADWRVLRADRDSLFKELFDHPFEPNLNLANAECINLTGYGPFHKTNYYRGHAAITSCPNGDECKQLKDAQDQYKAQRETYNKELQDRKSLYYWAINHFIEGGYFNWNENKLTILPRLMDYTDLHNQQFKTHEEKLIQAIKSVQLYCNN